MRGETEWEVGGVELVVLETEIERDFFPTPRSFPLSNGQGGHSGNGDIVAHGRAEYRVPSSNSKYVVCHQVTIVARSPQLYSGWTLFDDPRRSHTCC